jgi:hypothetical protein
MAHMLYMIPDLATIGTVLYLGAWDACYRLRQRRRRERRG